jgi:uncharacterized protein (DUF362 family)
MAELGNRSIVAIAKVIEGDVPRAVEEAIDLLGGIEAATPGQRRIMLKPNLVADGSRVTTKPEVVEALARLMLDAGKEVLIGEGSAGAAGVNTAEGEVYRTWNVDILDRMQQQVFDKLGYTAMAERLGVPLVNLHTGEMATVPVPGALAFDEISMHRTLTEIDLLCSVPMMKTHGLATVTLGLKNVIGLYPGSVYGAVKSWVHDSAAEHGSPGVAYEILDMVRVNKMGLTVVDGTWAMEGNGPSNGDLVEMGLIIAGTSPLATDMVAASIMGIGVEEVPTFTVAHRIGMTPTSLAEIDVRGVPIGEVARPFKRPAVVEWTEINETWGVKVMV